MGHPELVQGLEEAGATSDPVAQLHALLAVWRDCRDPWLADAIHTISARLPVHLPPSGEERRNRLFGRLLASGGPAEIAHAVSIPWPLTTAETWRRLQRLAELPPDPRITTAVLSLLAEQQNPAMTPHMPVELVAVLERSGERRAMTAWGEHHARLVGPAAEHWSAEARRRLRPDALTASVRDGRLTAVEAGLVEIVTQRGALRSASNLPSLFAEVYADPESDEARDVLADALIEAGRPHGEFIRLQLARAQGVSSEQTLRREAELQWVWAPDWAPVPGIDPDTLEFERGFPIRGCVGDAHHRRIDPDVEVRVLTHPAMSTFRTLDWGGGQITDFSALERLKGLYLTGPLDGRRLPPGLRLLGLSHANLDSVIPKGIETVVARAIAPQCLPPSVRRIWVTQQVLDLPTLHDQLPPGVREIEMAVQDHRIGWKRLGWCLVLGRGPDGFTAGRVDWAGPGTSLPWWTDRWAAGLPAGLRRVLIAPRHEELIAAVRRVRSDVEILMECPDEEG